MRWAWLSLGVLGCTTSAIGDAGPLDAPGDEAVVDAPLAPSYRAPVVVGASSGLPEISGIVASRTHPGVFWVQNDSGNPAEIYALDARAALLATITLTGATNVDWEDIALHDGALYVGDHGDNAARTSGGTTSSRGGSIEVYRLPEPDPRAGDAAVVAERLSLTYPDGPHDCEAMFVDAAGDLWLVAKVDAGPAGIYVARAPLAAGSTLPLTYVTSIDLLSVTAADLSTDGTRIAVRNYGQIRVFPVTGTIADAFAAEPIRPARAGSPAEAIAFSADGYDLFTIAEGEGADLYRIPWE